LSIGNVAVVDGEGHRPGRSLVARRRSILAGMDPRLEALPGGDLVQAGIDDLARGAESIPALLVSIGADRLRRAGLALPEPVAESPERRLYDRLAADDSDSAHSRYNALIRRLISCERALECAGR
jgi:hypothetical protein